MLCLILSCSLLRNPVVHKPGYRSYIIHKLPQLRVLDFKRIRLKVSRRACYPMYCALSNPSPARCCRSARKQRKCLEERRLRIARRPRRPRRASPFVACFLTGPFLSAVSPSRFVPPAVPVQRPPPPKPTGPSQQEITRIRVRRLLL